jgi:uncharacterized protein YlxW (UPF0749 family)
VPAGYDAANYLVHDYELRDVVNLLWLAGAEAVAVNDERLVASTSIYCVGSTVIVNETRLSPPYDVRAIGNAAQLENTLQDPGVLKKLKSRGLGGSSGLSQNGPCPVAPTAAALTSGMPTRPAVRPANDEPNH